MHIAWRKTAGMHCKGRDLSLNQCYTFKTDRHHLIFMSVQEEQADWEKPYSYRIMYIDIDHALYRNAELGILRGAACNLLYRNCTGFPVWAGY